MQHETHLIGACRAATGAVGGKLAPAEDCRITETAKRVRIALAPACPGAGLFRTIAFSLQPAAP
jgi:hypothetical protein